MSELPELNQNPVNTVSKPSDELTSTMEMQSTALQTEPSERINHESEPEQSEPVPYEFGELSSVVDQSASMDAGRAGTTEATLTVELGRLSATFGQVTGWLPGDLVVLDGSVNDQIDIYADGVLVARGNLVTVDGEIAVEVSEVTS